AFFFVTLPLALPIAVVRRFITMVRQYDIPVGGIVVNEVLTEDLATGGEDYLRNKYQEQQGYMTTIKRDLGELVRGFVPLYQSEVAGSESIRRVADDLFAFRPGYWDKL